MNDSGIKDSVLIGVFVFGLLVLAILVSIEMGWI